MSHCNEINEDEFNNDKGDDDVMLLNLDGETANESVIVMAPGQGKKPLS